MKWFFYIWKTYHKTIEELDWPTLAVGASPFQEALVSGEDVPIHWLGLSLIDGFQFGDTTWGCLKMLGSLRPRKSMVDDVFPRWIWHVGMLGYTTDNPSFRQTHMGHFHMSMILSHGHCRKKNSQIMINHCQNEQDHRTTYWYSLQWHYISNQLRIKWCSTHLYHQTNLHNPCQIGGIRKFLPK